MMGRDLKAIVLAGLLCVVPVMALRLAQDSALAQSPNIVRECTAHLPKSCGSCVGQMPNIVTCEIEKTYPQTPHWVVDSCVRELFARTRSYNIGDAGYRQLLQCAGH